MVAARDGHHLCGRSPGIPGRRREHGRPAVELPAVGPTEPVDVTGAGDTVIAVFTLALATGLTYAQAAEAANHAGGLVVMKKGTASVSMSELIKSIRTNPRPSTAGSTA